MQWGLRGGVSRAEGSGVWVFGRDEGEAGEGSGGNGEGLRVDGAVGEG